MFSFSNQNWVKLHRSSLGGLSAATATPPCWSVQQNTKECSMTIFEILYQVEVDTEADMSDSPG